MLKFAFNSIFKWSHISWYSSNIIYATDTNKTHLILDHNQCGTNCASIIIMLLKILWLYHVKVMGLFNSQVPNCNMFKATLCISWHRYHHHKHCFVNLVNEQQMCCNANYVDLCFIKHCHFPFLLANSFCWRFSSCGFSSSLTLYSLFMDMMWTQDFPRNPEIFRLQTT